MPESVDLVKQVLDDLRSWRSICQPENISVIGRFDRNISLLEKVQADVVRLATLTSALPPDLGNVYELPAELREELSIAKIDELEDQIVTVINAYQGEASLDQILVGLYRKFNVSQKRRFLQNKLYRMTMVWSVDGRKGVYTTEEPYEMTASDVEEINDTENLGGPYNNDLDDEIPF